MQSVRQIQRLNDAELEKCVPPSASWHTDYRDTAYIHVGGLPFELSEGDVLTMCSQYGVPVHVSLVRDKDTGKSRGFAFVKYEDQRSCDLAVDNLSGALVLGRTLAVDHARYKLKDGEIEGAGMEESDDTQDDDTDKEGDSRRKRRRTSEEGKESDRPRLREEEELAALLKEHDAEDPMKAYLIKEKKEQVAEALKRLTMKEDGHRKEQRRRRRGIDREAGDGSRSRRRSPRRRPRRTHRQDEASQDERRESRGERSERNARRSDRSRSRDRSPSLRREGRRTR